MHYPNVLEYNRYGNEIHVSASLTHARTTIATTEEDPHARPMDEGIPVIAMIVITQNWA